jgi:soluble lytic murein transglycosylase-like protein
MSTDLPATHAAPRQFVAAAVIAAVLSALPFAVSAQVYTGTEANGTLVLSNHSSDQATTLLIASDDAAAPGSAAIHKPAQTSARANPATSAARLALRPWIRDAAARHSVSESLLTAVIAVESGFDQQAVSHKGAKGLMQLMPDTARRFGAKDVFAVQDNLHAGAAYLRSLMLMFDQDQTLALAAYNAGEGAVLRAGRRVPEYRETQQYVAKVLAYAGREAGRDVNKP